MHIWVKFLCMHVQVYQLSIGAACSLSWPSDRIIIQVLDDSTDPIVKVNPRSFKSIIFPILFVCFLDFSGFCMPWN